MKRRAHQKSAVHLRRVAATTVTLCTALVLAGCSSSDGKKDEASDESSSVSQSPTSPAPADPEETAKKEAIAAYEAYWQTMEKLYADPTGKSVRLDQYAASAALANAQKDAKLAHDRGNVLVGDVAITEPTVTKADAGGKIPNVILSSCLDISKWETVKAKTKKPVDLPDNRLLKYQIVSAVEKYPAGWRVTSDEPQGKSC
ncbi:hypothetical protein [Streptomyces sp. PAN_FS17]|uniref:hypothetical protein n=1 Tax=Streptomyces sp. PAN_FS17 TaxID=1855351 RepID=UPI0008999C93|nr:hypothetical protein [Streptomyces sp. PAN_FS17]SEE10852.1 hypothetical protein SAMN05216482_9234 [Streptomyces sp. PAN_FS17]